ncbi:MAG TPA: DUF5602 domain-containing protein, partial [Candidatus Elarobacter sp.]|nr:DUF5602 domain-containing protein [Candidatus Elarobacter sp.]
LAAALAIAAIGIALACANNSGPDSKATTLYGPTVTFAQGTARAWLQTDATGAPAALGLSMTEGALSGLPTTAPGPSPTALMVTLPLPAEAAVTGFDHAVLGWNPNGHEPPQLYGAPHFDLHFYLVNSATQMAILPSDPQFATKAANFPSANFVPAGYVPPPGPAVGNAVPQMGVHWTSTSAPELNGQPFTNTFIYGSWDGKFIFLEPMITKAYLQTQPNTTQAIPQPAAWAAAGYYPTTYSVKYDAATKEYRFTLGGMTKRGG